MASGRNDIYKDAKKFKKGYDPRRNYKGRPKKAVSELMDEISDAKTLNFYIELTDSEGRKRTKKGKVKTKKTIKEMIATQMIHKALTGDLKATQELLDRMEGKPKQQIDLDTVNEINVGYSFDDDESDSETDL